MFCLRNLLVVLVASLISVVALADPLSQTKHQRIMGLAAEQGQNSVTVVSIDEANNALATMLMVGALNSGVPSGNSGVVRQFFEGKFKVKVLGVVGDDDALTAATVARALEDVKGKAVSDVSLLVVLDDEAQRSRLADLAAAAGVRLVLAPLQR